MPALGEDFILSVSTTSGGTFATVADMNSYSKNSSRSIDRRPVFGRATPYAIMGAREQTFRFGGYYNATDAGQTALRTAEKAGTTVFVKVLPDGTNGFIQEVYVHSQAHETDAEGLQGVTFEFTAADESTASGTGPAW